MSVSRSCISSQQINVDLLLGRWNVEYDYYRWIPNWDTIDNYASFGWYDKWFLTSESAEKFANNLNSIADVKSFHEKQFNEHENYLVRQAEYYKTKYIK